MALNFSHRPIFPVHLPEDNLVSPMRISSGYLVDGVSERNSDGFGMPWLINREVKDCLDFREDTFDGDGSPECVSRDILDLLPPDPFGMDISTTFTAITGWLEDLEADYGVYGRDESAPVDDNYQFFAGLNFIWNNALRMQAFPAGNKGILHDSDVMDGFSVFSEEREAGDVTCHSDHGSPCMVDTIRALGIENPETSRVQFEDLQVGNWAASDAGDGLPHAAVSFALGFLGVRDLLVVETVCKSLRSIVQGDPLFWRSIHIDEPLNDKLTDDILLKLTNKAQGNLQCLSLVKCAKITDDGLKEVLRNNPKLTKLCVPGCTRLSIEGIMSNLRAFKSMGTPGIKHLSIGGLYGVTQNHFEELKFLLGTVNLSQLNTQKPQFYCGRNSFPSCNGGRAIDIETCPKCQNLRLVYDCPVIGCKGKEDDPEGCRACTLCIARCVQCGRCINDNEYEETFCLELLCLECWKQQLSASQESEGKVSPSILAEETCSISLYG